MCGKKRGRDVMEIHGVGIQRSGRQYQERKKDVRKAMCRNSTVNDRNRCKTIKNKGNEAVSKALK